GGKAGATIDKFTNAHFITTPDYGWELLQLNLTNPLFQDKAVRKALELALDKATLVKNFINASPLPLAVNFPPLSPFTDTSLQPAKYDPAGAKKLLQDNGWQIGPDGIRVKNGQRLAFSLSTSTNSIHVTNASLVVDYWKAIGV